MLLYEFTCYYCRKFVQGRRPMRTTGQRLNIKDELNFCSYDCFCKFLWQKREEIYKMIGKYADPHYFEVVLRNNYDGIKVVIYFSSFIDNEITDAVINELKKNGIDFFKI
ncbi:MAG: hypothetical protein N3A01_04700 [Bacteroidales bacterium]|nr:hypothetical protein [Bacteroidales bacterium]